MAKRKYTERFRQKCRLAWNNRSAYLLMAPFMIIFFTFTVLPVLMTIVLSFTEYNILQEPTFVGWQNYRELFVNDDEFGIALRNTVVFALITGPIGYFLSFFAAWIINEFKPLIRGILTFIFYIPTISGTVYTIWGIIFSSDMYGFANSFLLKLGIIDNPIEWFSTNVYILPLIIIVQLWMSMGSGFLVMRAGTAAVDRQYYEAAAIDGVRNRFQEVIYVTIPMMAPHLMTAAVLQITGMFANVGASVALAGFPSTNYAGHLIMTHLMDYSSYRVERGYASAISVVLFILMISINAISVKLLRKVGT
ncbi:MAG: sugar ABC transporter permease [Oscillospiraceae bacterium]|nr:sugar ABC transporter permease [Oscillospiraceae bacterium]